MIFENDLDKHLSEGYQEVSSPGHNGPVTKLEHHEELCLKAEI
jgi:hypothetical protein